MSLYQRTKRKSIILFAILYILFVARTFLQFPFIELLFWLPSASSTDVDKSFMLSLLYAVIGIVSVFVFYALSAVFVILLMAGFSGFGSKSVPSSPYENPPQYWEIHTPEEHRDNIYTRFLLLSVYPLLLGLPLFPWLSSYQFVVLSVAMMVPVLRANNFMLYYIHRELFPLWFWVFGQIAICAVFWLQTAHLVLDILAWGLFFVLVVNLVVFHFLKQRLDTHLIPLKIERENKDFSEK